MKLDFKLAPYVSNSTDLVLGFEEKKSYPDVFVIEAGLWDTLQINNATDYVPSDFVNDGAGMYLVAIRSPNCFWLGMPKLINSMLNTHEKREKMTEVMWQAYTDELHSSKLLQQSADGMHYEGVVYEAAIHVMLNELLIESNQKLPYPPPVMCPPTPTDGQTPAGKA
ncbi:unnamed protein product [Withania somnifera]